MCVLPCCVLLSFRSLPWIVTHMRQYTDVQHALKMIYPLGSELRVLLPDRLADVRVRVLAAAAKGHVVVAQDVSGPRGPLAQAQKALVYFEHTVVQQLVQDGCRVENTGNTHLGHVNI